MRIFWQWLAQKLGIASIESDYTLMYSRHITLAERVFNLEQKLNKRERRSQIDAQVKQELERLVAEFDTVKLTLTTHLRRPH